MASTTITDGDTDIPDATARLTQMADRTSLMAIDAALRATRDDTVKALLGLGAVNTAASTAEEVREMARRMLQATRDFRAVLHEPAD